MTTLSVTAPWPRLALGLAVCLSLLGCAGGPTPPPERTSRAWVGYPTGTSPTPNPYLKKAMIDRAIKEWDYFGRQVVVMRGREESIPHVGAWEDDDASYSDRVAMYWRAVGKRDLSGMDCRQPWSAAFISWIMQGAGVPDRQFRPAIAHSTYLAGLIEDASLPGRWFVPRRLSDYSPRPGDLICAGRGASRPAGYDGYVDPWQLLGNKTHCDLVVAKNGQTLEVIGGNVRNSVSRTTLELDAKGHLQPLPRRPWFVIVENRL